MELVDLIESIRQGNDQAFSRLVANYRDMALGYAMTLLHQEQSAEDAVQEALMLAYTHLDGLRDPNAFGAWFRGIVRHQCYRARRSHPGTISMEQLEEMGADTADPAFLAQQQALWEEIRAEISRLSSAQQEVLKLFYEAGLSQKDIATQLHVTVATVNMRLHAARKRLRRRFLMESDALIRNPGHIQASQGPVVTIQFAPNTTPALFSLLHANGNEPLCVVQQLGAGRVRAVSAGASQIWATGQDVVATGEPFIEALPLPVAQQTIDALRNPAPQSEALPSGIKTIEVFAPLSQGGNTGIFAEMGLGVLVLLPELLRNLDQPENRQTFFVCLPPLRDVQHWREITAEITPGNQNIEMIYLPVADPVRRDVINRFENLDSTLVLSRSLAEQAIWPCLDPQDCHSKRRSIPRQEKTIASVRELLKLYYSLQFSPYGEERHSLSAVEWLEVRRARKVLRFLSQPFFVAEPYTGKPGAYVSAEGAFEGFARIVEGSYDAMPNEALYMVGAAPQ